MGYHQEVVQTLLECGLQQMPQLLAKGRIAVLRAAPLDSLRYIFIRGLFLGGCGVGGLFGGVHLALALQIDHRIQQITVTCTKRFTGFRIADTCTLFQFIDLIEFIH